MPLEILFDGVALLGREKEDPLEGLCSQPTVCRALYATVQSATASFQLLPSQLWTMRPFHGVRLVAGVHSTSLPSHSGLGRQACGRNRCFGGK